MEEISFHSQLWGYIKRQNFNIWSNMYCSKIIIFHSWLNNNLICLRARVLNCNIQKVGFVESYQFLVCNCWICYSKNWSGDYVNISFISKFQPDFKNISSTYCLSSSQLIFNYSTIFSNITTNANNKRNSCNGYSKSNFLRTRK